MSLSPRASRIIRAALPSSDAFVLDGRARRVLGSDGPVASAEAILAGAEARARDIVSAAELEAARILSAARASAGAVTAAARDDGHAEGYANGHAQAIRDAAALVDFVRRVADEGRAIRDQVADEAAQVVARATAYAVRRIVGEYYQQEPERTHAAVEDAIRAASGQQIVSIRVSPGLVTGLRARLTDLERYLVPDAAVEIGGCVIDLEGGTLDATLDTRLNLIELALGRAAGEEQP